MKEEMYKLISMAQCGNNDALESIIRDNKGLVWCVVRKFAGRGVETDDLFQIGSIGLIKAVNKFDTSFNVEFSTYAIPMILGEIRRFLRDDGIVKVSRNLKEIAMHARKLSDKILAEEGRDASVFEIAEKIGVSCDDVVVSLEATQPTESLYKTVFDGESSPVLLIDKFHSEENSEEKILTYVSLKQEIKNLPPKERQILILRYYKEKTQSEVAKILGISQVQVSRIEKKLLSTLRTKII